MGTICAPNIFMGKFEKLHFYPTLEIFQHFSYFSYRMEQTLNLSNLWTILTKNILQKNLNSLIPEPLLFLRY